MGPPGWPVCQLWDHPGVAWVFPVVGALIGVMSYREVSVIEIVEMLRLWLAGVGVREAARLSGTERKTVRRYVGRARACGLDRDGGEVSAH